MHIVLESTLTPAMCWQAFDDLQQTIPTICDIWQEQHLPTLLLEVVVAEQFYYLQLDFKDNQKCVMSMESASEPPDTFGMAEMMLNIAEWLQRQVPGTQIKRHTLPIGDRTKDEWGALQPERITTLKQLLQNQDFLAQGWGALFGNDHPLNLEIGCGYGHFLIHMAREHPESNVIGIDLISKLINKVANQIQRLKLSNALALKADGMIMLQELIPDATLQNIYINFPDPWHKEKHRKRRIIKPSTLPIFERKLQSGGHLHFVTDDRGYAEDVRELLADSQHLKSVTAPVLPVLTKYERKWRAVNREIYRLCYQKTTDSLASNWLPPAFMQEYPFSPVLDIRAFYQSFCPFVFRSSHILLKFGSCFINHAGNKCLINITLAEPGFLSHSFFIEVFSDQIKIPFASYIPRLHTQKRVWEALMSQLPPRSSTIHSTHNY